MTRSEFLNASYVEVILNHRDDLMRLKDACANIAKQRAVLSRGDTRDACLDIARAIQSLQERQGA